MHQSSVSLESFTLLTDSVPRLPQEETELLCPTFKYISVDLLICVTYDISCHQNYLNYTIFSKVTGPTLAQPLFKKNNYTYTYHIPL